MKKKSPKSIVILLFICFNQYIATAQNVGIGTSVPAASAKLDITSTNSGLLIPRVALTMTTSASPITAPTTSLLVYNTATVADVTPGFYFWNGASWTKITIDGSNWSTTGNSGITTSNFIGTINAADFITRTTNTERMRITAGGNVGIGDASPAALFTVGSGDLFQVVSTGQARSINGTASLPSFSFTGDPDNGMYLSATNELSFSTASTQRIVISSAGNVGIGTSTPTYAKLHVIGNSVFSATTAVFTASTHGAYIRGNDGFSTSTTPDYSWFNSDQTGLFHPSASVIGFCTNGIGEVMRISSNRLGIGTTNPLGLLELGLDQARKPGTSTWTIVSDERLKTIEGSYKKGLKELMQLNAIVYHYKNTETRTFSKDVLENQNIGFSAQEVQKIFPEAVSTDPDGYLNLNNHAILIAYLNAIKEQQVEIELLKTENANYKTELSGLKKEVEEIKKSIKN